MIVVLQMFVHIFYIVFIRESIRNAFVECRFIRFCVEYDCVCFLTVTPCPPGFLELSFGGVGEVQMDHDAYIRFVNTHTKRIGGYHDPALTVLPSFLAEIFGCIV